MKWMDFHCDTLSELYKGTEREETLKQNTFAVDLERLRKTESQAQFFACYVNLEDYKAEESCRGGRPDRAYEDVLGMIRMVQKLDGADLTIVKTAGQLDEEDERQRCILTVEEGGVLNGKEERLTELYEKGIRLITLTWNYKNCLGSPNSRDDSVMGEGLTTFGMEVLEQMNEMGILADVSHLSDGGFWDCIRQSRSPVVASHSNARTLCGHPRNLSDEMLHALGNKGGVVGINFYSAFLCENRKADIGDIVRHMCHVMQKAGEDAVALGSDFDGFSPAFLPESLAGVQDMERLWDRMGKEGITERQKDKIVRGNIRRVIRDVWK